MLKRKNDKQEGGIQSPLLKWNSNRDRNRGIYRVRVRVRVKVRVRVRIRVRLENLQSVF